MNIKVKKAFTLMEIIVSITILSIIILSVIEIYIIVSDISLKSEINRMMQENIKNAIEKIAEDVRINGASWVSEIAGSACSGISWWKYIKWTKLCICTKYDEITKMCSQTNEYYLAKPDGLWGWTRAVTSLTDSDCDDIKEHCIIVKNLEPITNSFVSVKDLQFSLSNDPVSKVTINMTMQPSVKKWVKTNLIIENEILFQTTVSNRPFLRSK